jgi:hypothetical protein
MDIQLRQFTVGYPVRGPRGQEEVMMGKKAYTPKAIELGVAGKYVGFGGGFKPLEDKTVEEGFIREFIFEETVDEDKKPLMSVSAENVRWMARIVVHNTARKSLILDYFLAYDCKGTPPPVAREILNPRYVSRHDLPEPIPGLDKIVLPMILDGKKLVGYALYDGELRLLKREIMAVDLIERDVSRIPAQWLLKPVV